MNKNNNCSSIIDYTFQMHFKNINKKSLIILFEYLLYSNPFLDS